MTATDDAKTPESTPDPSERYGAGGEARPRLPRTGYCLCSVTLIVSSVTGSEVVYDSRLPLQV